MMNFVDTHAHLHFPDFSSDVEAVIARAREAGVSGFVNVGTNLESSKAAVRLSESCESMFAAVGIHPHDAGTMTEKEFQEVEALATHPKVAAIGEVGLDFFRNVSPPEAQRQVLSRFLKLARKLDLPLVLHIRDAYEETIEILKAEFGAGVRGVSHCFAGSPDIMGALLRLGLYISFAGPVTYKKNDSLREAARVCPEERLLIETDAPYLSPQAFRGKRNEPAYLIETAKRIADIRGATLEELADTSTGNAERLFNRSFFRKKCQML